MSPRPPAPRFVIRASADRAELAVHGELDASNTVELHDAVSRAGPGHGFCVIDLTRATYLDSAGINTLFRLHRELTRAGIRLHLVAPTGSCPRYALNLVCAHDVMPVHDGIAGARAAVNGGGC
ncbi:STAS domain-containing protein [Spongiactinospora sp. TRM90649]|uniref:STAS domain-containing protein n=1 Tax=Spongiactinospora sp. TRM90649 TaxID=3031114 RepID=UPI0023F9BDF9|nr:STAS domain-containing protein [Spongiactinospora sp. TRM90649]MDF5753764.1 STAS domain-containing protein [Spongiactinospora sp. TRM90649]